MEILETDGELEHLDFDCRMEDLEFTEIKG